MSIFGSSHKEEKSNPSIFIETIIINIGEEKPHHHKPKPQIRPHLAFNIHFNNKNFNYMAIISNLTLTSTAPVTLGMAVVDANNANTPIAGVLSGLAYNVDATQDIAVVDPTDPLSVDIHAVAPTGGSTVTGTGNFVSTLLAPDGTTPAFSGTVTGTLVLVNNIPVAVLNPALTFNR